MPASLPMGQTLDAQLSALRVAGADKIFSEKVSGPKTDRQALHKALQALGEGDLLIVTRMDRLARSTRDLLNIPAQITEKGAAFRSLGDPLIDTTSAHDKIITAILGSLAEFERSMILARTRGPVREKAKTHQPSDQGGPASPTGG